MNKPVLTAVSVAHQHGGYHDTFTHQTEALVQHAIPSLKDRKLTEVQPNHPGSVYAQATESWPRPQRVSLAIRTILPHMPLVASDSLSLMR